MKATPIGARCGVDRRRTGIGLLLVSIAAIIAASVTSIVAAAYSGSVQPAVSTSAFQVTLRREFTLPRLGEYHQAIANCMRGAGFDWTPAVAPDPASAEDRAISALAAIASNDAYRRSLSESRKGGFDVALYGPGGPIEFFVPVSGDSVSLPVGSAGCIGTARDKVFGALDVEGIAADIESSIRQVEAHPLVAEAWVSWSECAARKGITSSDFKGLMAEFDRRMSALIANGQRATPDWASLAAERSRAISAGEACYLSRVADIEARVRAEVESALAAEHPEVWAQDSGN